METLALQPGVLFAYIIGIGLIYFIGKVFVMPVKFIWKFIYNGLIGGIMLWIVNFVGSYVGFEIGINVVTALVAGFLGIPGVVLLIAFKLFF
ncbi:pro-sigmaK processing inhibitor BofA family protein [Anaerosinus sp.]|uniref:pro-sigmaK processing inhibitor BofA family protein n=1 Tax=Selenobaculum sp. TaxID=3074374 RepID=UPI0015B09358